MSFLGKTLVSLSVKSWNWTDGIKLMYFFQVSIKNHSRFFWMWKIHSSWIKYDLFEIIVFNGVLFLPLAVLILGHANHAVFRGCPPEKMTSARFPRTRILVQYSHRLVQLLVYFVTNKRSNSRTERQQLSKWFYVNISAANIDLITLRSFTTYCKWVS